jgi:hypothetical protein
MVRARLAFLTLASSLFLTSGCASTSTSECSTGWLSRFRLASHTKTTAAPCECQGGMPMTAGDGTVVVPPNAFVPPTGFAAPPPNGFAAPPPTIINTPGQPPRIIPVPQANPMPYTPG